MVEPERSMWLVGTGRRRRRRQKRRFDWLAVGGGVIAKRFNVRRGKCVLCSISGSFNAGVSIYLILRIEHN